MTNKILIGMGVLAVTAIATHTTASAAGAGASARAHMNVKAKSLAHSVALSPQGIRRSLRSRGYYDIRFIDRSLPVYRVRACKNGKKFRIRLNRWGEIRNRVRTGWCDGGYGGPGVHGLSLPEIRRKLRNRGYYNIHFTDRHLPVYRAKACRNGRRYVLKLNRFGKVMDRDRRGWCGFGIYRDGPRKGAGLHLRGPGFSVTVKKPHRH